MMRCIQIYVWLAMFLLGTLRSVEAQIEIKLPEMPHLPPVRIPEMHIPPVRLPNIPIGHKTNKWDVRHHLEADGWWVAYGKEIGYEEYAKFSAAIAASVAAENPGPAMAYLGELMEDSALVLAAHSRQEFGQHLAQVAQQEILKAMHDAVTHGRVTTIRIKNVQFQIGMATYHRSESGVPLPITFQPYTRMRLILDHDDGTNHPNAPAYDWVTTIFNPSSVELHYRILEDGNWQSFSVAPKGFRWHAMRVQHDPGFRIIFDSGPAANHANREYALNSQRLLPGTQPAPAAGEPYSFGIADSGAWDLFRGRPHTRFLSAAGLFVDAGRGAWIMHHEQKQHRFQEKERTSAYVGLECISGDHPHVRILNDRFLVLLPVQNNANQLSWQAFPSTAGRWE